MPKGNGMSPAEAGADAGSAEVWYIERAAGQPSLEQLRRRLAEQGVRRVEVVTDRVIRCWAACAPVLPGEWRCQVIPGVAEPAAAAPAVRAGDLVRVQAGPAAGSVGRVRAVEAGRALVEVVVWGRGLAVKVGVAELERLAGLPWERPAPR